MFSFRRDKMGFFAALILLLIVGGTVIGTIALIAAGIAQGSWKHYLLGVKWILGTAWVLCIATVLTRIAVFNAQRRRRTQVEAAPEEPAQGAAENSTSAPHHSD